MRPRAITAAAALAFLCLAGPAPASLHAHFGPRDQTVEPGEAGALSIILDEAVPLRTLEIWVEYDGAVIESVDGAPGKLFNDSGCMVFDDFVDSEPDRWYGTAITIGYSCWVEGPGEIFRWEFRGLDYGICPIRCVDALIYDPSGDLIEHARLMPARIVVGEGTGAPAGPAPVTALALCPNPFNPATRLVYGAGVQGAARLEVYDLAGRRLADLWEGELDGGERRLDWLAVDDAGRPLPAGVYLFRLAGPGGILATARGILVK